MRFSTLLTGLTTLLATSVASPAPLPAAEPAPVANAEPEAPYQTSGPLAGNLPKNFAKVWVFDDLECNDTNGKTWMVNVLPGEDRCLPYTNVGSIFAWYKSDYGKCEVTTHGGSNCRGWKWLPTNKQCNHGLFASVRVKCPPI